jgi:hypothetical protein
LLLHAKHASHQGHGNIDIHSPDTDVEVIAINQSEIARSIYILTKNKDFVNIQGVAKQLGIDICKALPGLHAFTRLRL